MHMHWAEKPSLERHVTLPLFPNAALEMCNQALPILTSDGIHLLLARLNLYLPDTPFQIKNRFDFSRYT